MKEIISAVIFVVTLLSGAAALKTLHDSVRKAALEKAAQGMPSLTEMTRNLQKKNK